jgi:hypothetical protein
MLLDTNCVECGNLLTANNWQPSKKERNSKRCSSCCNARSAKWKESNPEKVKEYKNKWSIKNKDKIKIYKTKVTTENKRKHSIKTYYGVSWEEYLNIYQKSDGKCSICATPLSVHKEQNKETACVDHCHTTGKIRGILCRTCNRGIGYLRDSPELLKIAAGYLEKHNAKIQNET